MLLKKKKSDWNGSKQNNKGTVVRRSGLSFILILAVALLVAFLTLRSIGGPTTETPEGSEYVNKDPVQQATDLVEEYNSKTDVYDENAE